mgnify:FL=1
MWPKVITQLFELLPHTSRLVPMADKYFNAKAAKDEAAAAAMLAMAEGVRGDLGQVTQAHAGLYRQIQEQSVQIAAVAEAVQQTRQTADQQAARLEALELQMKSLARWTKAGVSLLTVLLAVVIWLLIKAH